MRLNFIIGYNGYSFVLVLGHELVTKVCLFVAFLDLRSRTLYKRQLLQYIDIVGVVFSLSGFVQLFSDPAGSLTHAVHCPKYQYFNYRYPFEGVRFGH